MNKQRRCQVAPFACLALCLSGCGGSSPTAPAAAATTAPCTQSTLFQGGFELPASTADFESFTTTTTGRLDLTFDWTFTSSSMGLFVVQGPCSFDQFKANACSFLLQLVSPPKPLKGSISNLAPGTYGLIIANANTVQESISIGVFLKSSSCPTASSVAGQSTHTPSFGSFSGLVGRRGR